MPTYIVLGHFTQKGAESLREHPARIDFWKQLAPQFNVTPKGHFLLMGHYDFITIFEAPDAATMAQAILTINLHGNYRTETLRAFSEEEFQKVIADLP